MKDRLIKGALFVSIASLIVKVLSIVYKIPYQNITGDKGFYIFQQMYPLYALVTSAAAFAIPLTVSETKNVRKAGASLFYVLLSAGTFLSLVILFLNRSLARILNDAHLYPVFFPLILALMVLPFVAVGRGILYSDVNKINRVGISLIIEQTVRVGFILFILWEFYEAKITDVYAAASYSFLGYGIGLLVAGIYVFRKLDFKDFDIGYSSILMRRMFFLLISSSVLVLIQFVDSLSLIHLLSEQMPNAQAMVTKGIYDRSLPLVQTAVFFVSPVISSLLPHIKDKRYFPKLVNLIVFLAAPVTAGLIYVAPEVNRLLFLDSDLSAVIRISLSMILFYAIILTLSAVTESKKTIMAIIGSGLLLKLALNLVFIHLWGIAGAALSSAVAMGMMMTAMIVMNRKSVPLDYKLILKTVFSALFMILFLHLSGITELSVLILSGGACYFLFAFLFRIKLSDLLINHEKQT